MHHFNQVGRISGPESGLLCVVSTLPPPPQKPHICLYVSYATITERKVFLRLGKVLNFIIVAVVTKWQKGD